MTTAPVRSRVHVYFDPIDAPQTIFDSAVLWLLTVLIAFAAASFGAVQAWSEGVFLDIGVRVSEAAGIMLPDDLDLDDQVVVVLGQGRRPRRSPSVARLPWRLTATCGCGQAIRSPTCRTSGSAWPGP